MNEHAAGFSEKDLSRAIESNGEEFLLALGRAAGAEEHDDGRIRSLHYAREMGCRVGVLGSSEMGYPVYRRLGFREYCRIGIYEYRPLANEPASF